MEGLRIKSITKSENATVHCVETEDHELILDNGLVSHNSMGLFGGNVVSGGSGLKYASSGILEMTKRKVMDGKDKTGNIVTCRNTKGRLTKEGAKAEVLIDFLKGLSRYHGMVEAAVAAEVWEKAGNRVVIEGTKLYPKVVYKDPEKYFNQEILDKINGHVSKLYKYGSSIEEIEVPNMDVETSEE